MSLKHSYALIAPFYDAFLTAATHGARGRSLAALAGQPPGEVLIAGIGTGLDIPHLPPQHRYVGIDLTRAMLAKAQRRIAGRHIRLVQGDVQRLPFPDTHFDAVVLHLILAVVPEPNACLAEAARVLKPGGHILVFDKFLKPGERALWKRAMNSLTRHVATRLDVVFEDVLAAAPNLQRHHDEPALAGGWFRLIRLHKPE
ncbi:MAG: methyltransferase domain-containing protein [Rhodocyclales bacterium]|nr:methyltransferase domain-containing protein [Rhodocyclales bacterium]